MNIIDENLSQELVTLKAEHEKLGEMIEDLLQNNRFNQIEVQKLKKEKLRIKDRINYIESIIYPDIIA